MVGPTVIGRRPSTGLDDQRGAATQIPGYRGWMSELGKPGDREVDFSAAIEAALDDLPEAFADRLGSVAIVVEDEPTPDQLASVDAPGLFGLYQGVPRTRWGADAMPIPSKITLFRGPLSRANPDARRLTEAIRATVHHEIAHHFGIDDERLHELQRR